MPIIDKTDNRTIAVFVASAYTWLTRLIGLIGEENRPADHILHIRPCRSIHTFGMRYPVDMAALSKTGQVVQITESLAPNKIAKLNRATRSVLEGPVGWVQRAHLQIGSLLQITADQRHQVNRSALQHLFHWPLNIFIALLWSRLVLSLVLSLQSHPSFLNIAMLVHNTLILIFFLLRRKSKDTSTRFFDWLVPFATIGCAMSLRPSVSLVALPTYLPVLVQSIGIIVIILSLLSLGRSFGVVPANRQLKLSGAYKFVRHPLYTGEMVFFLGFFMGNFSMLNGFLTLLIFTGQIWRAGAEERLLRRDEDYQHYVKTVRYRFLPGLW